MDALDFLPSEETIRRIRRDLDAYEGRRSRIHAQVRWRVPVFMGTFALASAAVLFSLRDLLLDNSYFYLGIAVLGGLASAGLKLYQVAREPATALQEAFRADLFGTIFSFIGNMRHFRSSVPGSFSRLPVEATGGFDEAVFDDEFSGRMGDFRFQLYETRLERGQGKSSRTVFRGVILSFDLQRPFAGRFVATRRVGDFARLVREMSGGGGLRQVASGRAELDGFYEFRTDNEAAAEALIRDKLGKALDWLRDAWPDEAARIALADAEGFLLLPVSGKRNFFELPDISVPLDYSTHIGPMITDMAKLLSIGDLVRKAACPG